MSNAKMQFEYSGAPQRSPEWHKIRLGKITASRLGDWLAVSKAKNSIGKPLKPRLDYEKELMFERQFNTGFETWVSDAMQDGIDFEAFARSQYEKIKGVLVEECGCWYSQLFVASPDGTVGQDGLVEIKVLRDNSFSAVLEEGVPDKHWKQIQGQLWASKRKWCDYIAINLNTQKIKIIRVLPDLEFHEWLELAVPEPLSVEAFSSEGLYDFIGTAPQLDMAQGGMTPQDNKSITGGW